MERPALAGVETRGEKGCVVAGDDVKWHGLAGMEGSVTSGFVEDRCGR